MLRWSRLLGKLLEAERGRAGLQRWCFVDRTLLSCLIVLSPALQGDVRGAFTFPVVPLPCTIGYLLVVPPALSHPKSQPISSIGIAKSVVASSRRIYHYPKSILFPRHSVSC
jgi:hypothetical protein